ncbi:hypothetical protein ATN79_20255 [Paraburkholderia caribensis]|nr:hypothetical protein ATN79_20255 [Paraburkholderia caribensis]
MQLPTMGAIMGSNVRVGLEDSITWVSMTMRKHENINALWHPDSSNKAAMYAILDDRDRPYCEHRLAA